MKTGIRLALAVFCLYAVACAPPQERVRLLESARVARVIDGDTIELANGERVRYLHIDAPEVRRRVGTQWVYAPEPFAQEATRRNESLVGGKEIRLEYDIRERDRYGRLLAFVYVDDRMVNRILVSEGLADLLIIEPNRKYAEEFRALRDEARRAGIGIWSRP